MSTSKRLAKIEERMLREPAKIRPPWMTMEQVRGTDLYRLPEFFDLPEGLKDRAAGRDFTEEEIAVELKEQRIIMISKRYAEDDPAHLDPDLD